MLWWPSDQVGWGPYCLRGQIVFYMVVLGWLVGLIQCLSSHMCPYGPLERYIVNVMRTTWPESLGNIWFSDRIAMSIWSCLGRLTLRALNKGHMRTGWSLYYVSYMCVNDILLLQNVCALFCTSKSTSDPHSICCRCTDKWPIPK